MGRLDFSKSGSSSMVKNVMGKVKNTDMNNKKREIDMDLIDMNPDNEMIFGLDDIDYLASAIKEDGFVGAIEVFAKDNGRYEISAGHRRYLAARENGMKKIPCIVMEDTDDATRARRLIMSNIHQRKLTPLNWGKALQYYKDHVIPEGTKEVRNILAKEFNLSTATLQRYLKLLDLIPEFQREAEKEGFPYANYVDVANLNPEQQKIIYDDVMEVAIDGDLSTVSRALVLASIQRVTGQYETRRRPVSVDPDAGKEAFNEELKKSREALLKQAVADEDNTTIDDSDDLESDYNKYDDGEEVDVTARTYEDEDTARDERTTVSEKTDNTNTQQHAVNIQQRNISTELQVGVMRIKNFAEYYNRLQPKQKEEYKGIIQKAIKELRELLEEVDE